MGHGERLHAILSASSAHRWLNCTPSVLLEQQFPDTESEAAREGTLAHELAELKLRNYFYTVEFGKRKLANAIKKLKENELWQDEMMRYTEDYLDYIKKLAISLKSSPYVAIEKKVDFSLYAPDGFGTADCILIGGNTIYIFDFKYGKSPNGRVSAEKNSQMMLYALGAYEAYRAWYPISDFYFAIVQPRLPDGISEWRCGLPEILEFGEYVKIRAALAIKGEGDFCPDEKTCRFCRARGRCRARGEKNIQLAFSKDLRSLPPLLTNEQMGQYLTQGSEVAKWLKDLESAALKECLVGHTVPGWKAVEGRGSREWTDLDSAFQRLQENGIQEEILYERKPLTLAQVEKALGISEFRSLVGDYVIKKPGKPALVEESDKREAITNKISAKEAFQEEVNN